MLIRMATTHPSMVQYSAGYADFLVIAYCRVRWKQFSERRPFQVSWGSPEEVVSQVRVDHTMEIVNTRTRQEIRKRQRQAHPQMERMSKLVVRERTVYRGVLYSSRCWTMGKIEQG